MAVAEAVCGKCNWYVLYHPATGECPPIPDDRCPRCRKPIDDHNPKDHKRG